MHVKGEPLIHQYLDDILSICDNNKINVRITTNGTLLERKKDILLKHSIKQIDISLHNENNIKNYFEKVFNTSDELSKNTTIIYRIWTLPTLDLDKFSTKIVDKIINYYKLSPKTVDKIIKEKNIKIKDNIYLDKDFEFIWPKDSHIKSEGTCLGTKTHIAILSNGNIVPCCLDSSSIITLGNIFKDNLDDVINSDLFKLINNGFKNNKAVHKLCQNCTYKNRFNKE